MDRGRVRITQQSYLAGTTIRNITAAELKRENPALTAAERTELLSVIGSLQWLSSASRPDLWAGTSLQQRSQPLISDLKAMYALLAEAKSTPETGIVVVPLPLDTLMVGGYGDSSWTMSVLLLAPPLPAPSS